MFMNHKRLILFILLNFQGFLCSRASNERNDSLFNDQKKSFWKEFKDDSLYSFRSRKGYVPMLLHNFGAQALSPFHMSGKEALITSGIVVATAGIYFADADVEKKVRPLKDKNPWLKSVSPEFTQLGDYYGYALVAGYGVYSLVFQKKKALHTAILASQAAVTAGVWVRGIKLLTGRMRPGATYMDRQFTGDHWFGPFAQFDPELKSGRSVAAFDAFPSGHTAAAFSIATVFAMQYKDQRAVPVIAYSLASLVAVSRLIEHEHWASDLLPGAAIGYACGRQVVHYYEKLFPSNSTAKKNRTTSAFFFTNSNGIRAHFSLIF